MASANRVQLTQGLEATGWGSNINADTSLVPFTDESLIMNRATQQSNTIFSDRNLSGLLQTGVSVSGSVNVEFRPNVFDNWLVNTLQAGSWTNTSILDVNLTADGTETVVITGIGEQLTQGIIYNITVNGDTENALNGLHKVVEVQENDTIVLSKPLASFSGVVTIASSHIINGVAPTSCSIFKSHLDLNLYYRFVGMMIDKMSFDISLDDIVKVGFEFIGGNFEKQTSYFANDDERDNNDTLLDTVSGVNEVMEGGSLTSESDIHLLKLGFNIDNNLRALRSIGEVPAFGVASGSCSVSGNVEAHFENEVIAQKYWDNEVSSLSFVLGVDAGERYKIEMPNIQYANGSSVTEGINTDVIQKADFTASKGKDGYTIQVVKY